MGRFWPRYLLYGEDHRSASPMWARDSTRVPIFEEAVVANIPMWRSSLRLTNVPVFVDEDDPSPQPMWYRESNHVPVCPCCIHGTSTLPQLPSTCHQVSSSTRNLPAECTGDETSSVEIMKPPSPLNAVSSNIRLRHSVNSLRLKFKKSIRSLRHKTSGLPL